MTDQELEKKILKTREQINSLLEERTPDAYEKVYNICMAEDFQVQWRSDNEMIVARLCSQAWKAEQTYQEENVYGFITEKDQKMPLQQLKELYTEVKLYLLRIENHLPEEKTEEGMQYILTHNISGDFLKLTADENLEDPVGVLLLLASVMVEEHEYTRAARIYALLKKDDSANEQISIAQAHMYMEIGNYAEAYRYLEEIELPDAEVKKLLEALKPYAENGKEQK